MTPWSCCPSPDHPGFHSIQAKNWRRLVCLVLFIFLVKSLFFGSWYLLPNAIPNWYRFSCCMRVVKAWSLSRSKLPANPFSAPGAIPQPEARSPHPDPSSPSSGSSLWSQAPHVSSLKVWKLEEIRSSPWSQRDQAPVLHTSQVPFQTIHLLTAPGKGGRLGCRFIYELKVQ